MSLLIGFQDFGMNHCTKQERGGGAPRVLVVIC